MTAERRFEGRETPNRITKFSPEARMAIEEAHLPIFTLIGRSIRDLRQSGKRIEPEWSNQEYLENLPSRKSEVSIQFIGLENSFNKPMSQQQKLVKSYSAKLSERMPDVEAIIGEAPDYLELSLLYMATYGIPLFEYEVTLNPKLPKFLSRWKLFKANIYARTVTPLNSPRGSFTTAVSYWNGAHRIDGWPEEQGLHICGVVPLIIPRTY